MKAKSGFRSSFAREIRHLARNPWDLAMLTWLPLVLCGLVAWQVSTGVVRNLPVVIVDQDQTALSRGLAQKIEATPGLSLVASVNSMATAEHLVRSKQAQAAILVPPDMLRRALAGQAPVILYYNASYPSVSSVVQREVASVIDATNNRLATDQIAAIARPGSVKPAPVRAVTSIAWNPPASQELQLVSLLHPALLHLLFMLAIVSALGRELRDGTIADWHPSFLRVFGKICPYIAVFMGWAALATLWLAGVRGWSIAGSTALLGGGYLVMFAAYASVALLLVGATRTMSQALSLTGIYAGASFAFAGGVFPLDQASGFGRFWGNSLPFTNFARLLARTWIADAPGAALSPLLIMAALALITALPGLWLYQRAARDPLAWGRR